MRKILIALCLILFPTSANSYDGDFAEVGNWVVISQESFDRCYMSRSYDSGHHTAFYLYSNGDIYFTMFRENWRSIEQGKNYKINLIFGKNSYYTLLAMGRRVSDVSFGSILVNIGDQIFSRFMKSNSYMVLLSIPNDRLKNITNGVLNLNGNELAVIELRNCVNILKKNEDPFKELATDPFDSLKYKRYNFQ